MEAKVKIYIAELRRYGMGYKMIAEILGMKENTVKTFCHRNGLAKIGKINPDEVFPGVVRKACKNCGQSFLQYPGHREKIFCCDACRFKWWNRHISRVKRQTMHDYICPTCGKKFSAYENQNRKYCSHKCYITARYGRLQCE